MRVISRTIPLAAAVAILLLAPTLDVRAQWVTQASNTAASLRGISAVSAQVAWASGSGGTVLRTVDGGRAWRADTVPGATGLDFRDVHGMSAQVALLLTAGSPGRVYRTTDGGRNWRVVYEDTTPTIFFDGMAFWNARDGIAVSDPVDGGWIVIRTSDGGRTWTRLPPTAIPAPLAGEAAFAASGTMVSTWGTRHAWFVTGGGASARVYRTMDKGRSWRVSDTGVPASATAGLFSVAFSTATRGVAVGGDYRTSRARDNYVLRSADGGRSWQRSPPDDSASMYSAVVPARVAAAAQGSSGMLVAVGLGGTGVSRDGGRTWHAADTLTLHSASFAGWGTGWAVGPGGRVLRWLEPSRPRSRSR